MTDLRQAAEQALNYFEDAYWLEDAEVAIKEALRQALAEEALDEMVAENQRLGLYDDLQTAIERGTKAWADVPAGWVDELRGNDTPEVTTQVTTQVPCKTHPDAPHGFDRNASHSAGRYVCECEGWEPVDWEAVAADQAMTIAMMQIENKREWVGLTTAEVIQCQAAYYFDTYANIEAELKDKNSAPYTKLDTTAGVLHKEWVGLTDEDIDVYALDIGVTANKAPSWLVKYARDIEAALKEKNRG